MIKSTLIATTILLSFNVSAVEQDKVQHFLVSSAISGVTYAYTESWTSSLSACMAVGVAKELYDEYDYGGFDHKDLVADAVGCVTGAFISNRLSIKSNGEETSINYRVNF